MNLKIGDLLDKRYKIVRELDGGGFSNTFVAEDILRFSTCCVIKQFRYEHSENCQEARDLFREEAKILLKLENYPQVPKLLAYLEEEGCMVQEFIHGKTLQEETLDEQQILKLLAEILPVLKFVHEQGIVHKDIKPSNIMRRKDDCKLVLIDFGIAKQLHEINLTSNGQIQDVPATVYSFPSGTHGFQAPDGHSTAASDLYSLGATCIQLLTGSSPPALMANLGDTWVNRWQSCSENQISDEICNLIGRLIAGDARERYQSADEALRDVESNKYIRNEKHIESLISLLHSSEGRYKYQAINDLAEFGQDAKEAIPSLIKLLRSEDFEIYASAESALAKIGSEVVLPVAELLEDTKVEIRRSAAKVLEAIGAEASASTSKLITALEDPDPEGDVRWYATIAIGKIGLFAIEAIPSLIKRLEDNKAGIRAYAAWSLGEMGKEAQAAIPVILEALNGEKNDDAFLAYLEALEAIGYDITEININYDDAETVNANEHIALHREAQRKALEATKAKGGILLSWRRSLNANTPPQRAN